MSAFARKVRVCRCLGAAWACAGALGCERHAAPNERVVATASDRASAVPRAKRTASERDGASRDSSGPSAGAALRRDAEGSAVAMAGTVPSGGAVPFDSAVPSTSAVPLTSAVPSTSAVPLTSAVPSMSAVPVAVESAPLVDAEGRPLPQTDDEPKSDAPEFERRVELLVRAIVEDEPSRAGPTFFPLVAYEQVKAVKDPARDWEKRLFGAFERDIHEYHRALGPGAAEMTFAGIDVPEAASRWMKPGSEGNRIGYYRVLRSKLRLRGPNGKERAFEVTSMISWRGQWYVVHLHGFR